jgi:tetratricopeptide (TPR) repeat protein
LSSNTIEKTVRIDVDGLNLKLNSMNLEFEINQLQRGSQDAWARLDYEKSETLLHRRQKLTPQDPRPLLDLGFLSGRRCDYVKAVEYFEKAIRVSSWQTAAFTAAGWHCLGFSQPLMARGYFERALKKNSTAAEILIPLSGIYERLGQLDEAEDCATRAVKLTGDDKNARLVQAMVLRRRKRLVEAETILREIASVPGEDLWLCAHIGYELGLNLDQQGRYDEAMTEFLQAKKYLIPAAGKLHSPAERQSFRQQRAADAASVTREMFERFRAEGDHFLPPSRIAFLVGHPRSGTTLLEQVLDSHPEAVSSEETTIFLKEALRAPLRTFFENQTRQSLLDILNRGGNETLRAARDIYFKKTESFLGQPVSGRLLVDKNPSLTPHLAAITRIFPETKVIVALRDPRDVCLSCFMQPLPVNSVSASYLTLADTAAEYASMLGFWLAIREKMAAPWLEVRYEDMVNDLASVARRTLDFLGLPWNDNVLAFDKHTKSKIVRSPTYAAVGQPIYKGAKGRWRNYASYLEPHLAQLEPFIKAFGYE